MAKQSGLGDNFYIQGFDLSGDVASLDQVSGGPALLNVTAINKSANERIGGLRTGDMQFTSYWNASSGQEHAALSTLPRTDVIATYARGTALGDAAACVNGKQVNYDPTRDASGNLTMKVEVQSNAYGLEWGIQATPGLRTDTSSGTATAIDNSASTAFGAQGYLQVTNVAGTVDVQLRHSADNSTYTTLMDFGSQSAAGAVRTTAAGTVDRYIQVFTQGTFSTATFNVVLVRNQATTSF